MYTGHFGLDDGPFHGKAEGQEVYIGPQQAAVIARLRKVLAIADTAVAVSGPVGVGKTTLVRRALADLTGSKTIIPVDRMRLEPDEVLDLLLSRFDVSRQPKGTIQRVAAFRRLLHERLANDTRVFIVVEDAERVGVDALLELEALTATDSGEPVGANIVLMGAGELSHLLAKPALARLRQRIRLRQAVAPFDEEEVEGYMRHCLESAGGVLEQIFEPGTARIVYRYSGGIARVIDNLCESALVAAAEAELATILPEFLQEVAENCGLEPQVQETDTGADDAGPAPVEAVAAAGDEGEALAPIAMPAPLVAPPKLALVEAPPRAAGQALPDAAEDLPAPQPDAYAEREPSPPAADEAPGCAAEAGPAEQRGEDRESRGANVAVSRIDEVLPELLERLRAHARGVPATADAAQPVDASSGDSLEIPTLSNSMRVAVRRVRPMEARPQTAEDDDEDEVSAETQEQASAEAFPVGAEAAGQDGSPEDHAGIAQALTQTEREPEAEQPVEVAAEARPVEPEAEEVAAPEALAEEPAAAVPPPEESADRGLPAAPATEVPSVAEVPQPEQARKEAEAVAAPEETFEDRDPPAAEAGEIESPVEASASDELAEEAGAFELAVLSENESAAVVADDADDEVTTEAATLSPDEELALAPGVATDVVGTGRTHDGVDAGGPGLDALQAAIQAANAWQASESDEDGNAAPQGPLQAAAPDLPEITLDVELEKNKPAQNDLDRWADELSKAKSLEDISDILAETIFGNEEVEAISAEIRAKKATERAAAEGEAAAPKPAPREPQPVAAKGPVLRPSAPDHSTHGASSRHQAKQPLRPAAGTGINMTMSQRIEMVNSLKGKKPVRPAPGMQVSEIVLAEQPDEPLPPAGTGPQPIEAQIDTAITQSRKVLSEADLARLASSPDDDDDDKGGRGLFGFFRRSSKN